MAEAEDVYRATVDELFENFRSALLAILPIAVRAQINHEDAETHGDWERLAECLFDAFVRSPIDADRLTSGRQLRLARYDIDMDDYLAASWLASDASSPYSGAVVRFLTRGAPFDAVQVVDIDAETLRAGRRRIVPFGELNLAFYRRNESGEATVVTQIEADE